VAIDPTDGIKWYLVFLFSTCCHEAAHAWTAHRLGDDTALRGGQVTLDPTPHIRREPLGMVLVPLASFLLGGFMLGWASTPYDPEWAARHPRRAAWMALAGPAANLALVFAAAVLIRVGFEWRVFGPASHSGLQQVVAAAGASDGWWAFCARMASLLFTLNLMLGAFNLLPVPPLDGRSIPLLFLGREAAARYWQALRAPVFSYLGLFVAWRLMGAAFPAMLKEALRALYWLMPAR
jgi:Zn-dependent protease